MKEKVTKAIVIGAGLGTRMYPFTKVDSKLMIPVMNRPIIEMIVEELVNSGIKEITVVSNHITKIKQLFEENKSLNNLLEKLNKTEELKLLKSIEYPVKIKVIEHDQPMGWMYEVYDKAKCLKEEPILVCFSDLLFDSKIPAAKQVISKYEKTGKNIKSEGRFILKPSAFPLIEKEEYVLGEDVADIDVFEKLREQDDLETMSIDGHFLNVGETKSYIKTICYLGLKNKEFGEELKEYLKELIK
ncbi:NTP transferase domain-containing protein [Candidatus Woesearchaeota archaeon]|nr:NTP transferase domain-containing protein [Candidatus Woesearchaeota archaeon]